MVKKKNNMARRRKKSNTTTMNEQAKRSKIEKNPVEYRNGILHGLRVILGKMGDKELLAVMGYVSTMEEKQKSTIIQQPSMTVTATATEEATAIATATVNSPATQATTTEAANTSTVAESANPTTTEEVILPATTTTVPPSPEDPVIELNRDTIEDEYTTRTNTNANTNTSLIFISLTRLLFSSVSQTSSGAPDSNLISLQ